MPADRPARPWNPRLPEDTIDIPAPPAQPRLPEQNWLITTIPVAGIGIMALFYMFRAGDNPNSLLSAVPLLFLALITIGGTILAQRWRRRDYERQRLEVSQQYIRLLEKKRARLQAAYDVQVASLNASFPDPSDSLNRVLAKDHLWECSPGDAEFTAVRLGVGFLPSAVRIKLPDPDSDVPELERALALADDYRLLRDVPLAVSLAAYPSLALSGERPQVLKAARSLLCHLSLTHAPRDLRVHIIASRTHYTDWSWMEWLPHTSMGDHSGSGDLMAFEPEHIHHLLSNLTQVLEERRDRPASAPHLLLLVDDISLIQHEPIYALLTHAADRLNASLVALLPARSPAVHDFDAWVEIDDEDRFRISHATDNQDELIGSAIDSLTPPDAEHIARALSAMTVAHGDSGTRLPRRINFLELYAIHRLDHLRTLMDERWRRPIPRGVLPFPIEIGRESQTNSLQLWLDEDHHGPHGVLAGTTGAGKSELLQTMVCALALEHDPRLLNFLLIDFKGGSTFQVFAQLPHTVGTITNLDGLLIERALEALRAEIRARQQFLKRLNLRDITQYHRHYSRTIAHIQDPSYTPLPHLFILVDEFAQLAREMPDFLHELVKIAQVGRGLGLHLILATQSPMDVITDEMNANLQFRICLRVQNIEASRAMLRRPDAAYLPPGWPGRGYFQVGERGLFKQFQTASVGGDYHPSPVTTGNDELILELITEAGEVINLLPESDVAYPTVIDHAPDDGVHTTAQAIAELIEDYARDNQIPAVPRLLLAPLDDALTLQTAFTGVGYGGWNGVEWLPARDLRGLRIEPGSAPIGLIDDIYNRTQTPLWIHLNPGDNPEMTQHSGHLLIFGGPDSGKTTALRTLAFSLAHLHPPQQLHLYCLSFTGHGLTEISRLPHAETVIHGTEAERIRRLFARLLTLLEERQTNRSPHEPVIVVFIDQYEQFRDSCYESHMTAFERLVNEGRAVHIYLVITASTVTAVPERLRSLMPQRIALQLGNPADYVMSVGSIQIALDSRLPHGRGFIAATPPLACQLCLPAMDDLPESEEAVIRQMRRVIDAMNSAYLNGQGTPANSSQAPASHAPAPIHELPSLIPLDMLPLAPAPAHSDHIPHLISTLGRRDDDALSLFHLDWRLSGPHFVVTGPPGSGKTNLLQAAALAAAMQFPPDQMRLLLLDLNGRSLKGLAALRHTLCYMTDVDDFLSRLNELAEELQTLRRLPHPPQTTLIIDDYDVLVDALGAAHPALRQLRDLARQYSDGLLSIWTAGYLDRVMDPFIKQLLLKRSGFALSARDSLQPFGLRLSGLTADNLPRGRAFVPENNRVSIIQTALVENPALLINRIHQQMWPQSQRAAWVSTASPVLAHQNSAVEITSTSSPSAPTDLNIDTMGLIEDLLRGKTGE